MTGLEALQGVQFVSAKGKRFAVLSADDWEALIEWLETVEDVGVARQALAALKRRVAIASRRAGRGGRMWLETWIKCVIARL